MEFLTLDADRGAGGDRLGDEHVGTDDAVPANDRAAAQNGRAGVDGHVVLNGGMALLAPEVLSAPGGEGAKGYALIDLHMVADDGGLTHDNTGAMVDEEVASDGCAGVDVNAGDAVGVLGHDSRNQGYTQRIEHMGQPVDGDCKQAGVAEDDFVHAEGGGVSVKEGLHIGLGNGPDPRDGLEEFHAQPLGLFSRGSFPQLTLVDQGQLFVEIVHHVLDEHGQIVAHIVDAVGFVPAGAGVDDAHELADHVDDDFLIRVAEVVHLVDGPAVAVILQNAVNDGFHLFFHGSHGRSLLIIYSQFITSPRQSQFGDRNAAVEISTAAQRVKKVYVIPRERSDRGNPFP